MRDLHPHALQANFDPIGLESIRPQTADASVPRHQSCDIQSAPVLPEQGALRSEWPALYQQRNAALAAQARSLRASQEAAIRGVMPLGKGWAIPCEPCLAADRFLTR